MMAKVRFEGLKGGSISIDGKEIPISKNGVVEVPESAVAELIASFGAIALGKGEG
jgi:hypothetical protein